MIPLSWLIVRVAVGWNLLVHGYPKLLNGSNDAILRAFADLGYNPPAFWFWTSGLIETLGASRSSSGCSRGFLLRLPPSKCYSSP